jgi:hypothetical protein
VASLAVVCRRFSAVLRPILFQSVTYACHDSDLIEFYEERDDFIQQNLPPGTVREIVLDGGVPISQIEVWLTRLLDRLVLSSAVAARLTVVVKDVTVSAGSHWLSMIRHDIRQIYLIRGEDSKSWPAFFDEAVPMLEQLTSLSTLSIVDEARLEAASLAAICDFVTRNKKIRVLDFYGDHLPEVATTSLEYLGIAETALVEVESRLSSICEVSSVRTLNITQDYNGHMFFGRDASDEFVSGLVNTLAPVIERLVSPLGCSQTGNFPPSVTYLHITFTCSAETASLLNLCQAIYDGKYPALRYLVLDVDWHRMSDFLRELNSHGSYSKGVVFDPYDEMVSSEATGTTETTASLVEELETEYFDNMVDQFRTELGCMLDHAGIIYTMIPFYVGGDGYQQLRL